VRVSEGAGEGSGSPRGVKPGALTDLLRQVAEAPGVREAEPAPLLPGTLIGRFEVLRELGRGGFGVVYEARDRELGRQVALKLVRPGAAAAEDGKVVREAEAIARLAHPNLITLHDVGRSEHGPYLVFELLRGKTLQERIDDGPLPVQEAVHVAVEVARGLAHAHAEGVVHRDLKPSNVFVTNKGEVKILDFGMAHAFGRRRLSGGTPAYMAPEQWEDDPEDERTDVFALGVMLHRMLSGEYPFPEGEGRWSAGPATAPKLEVPGAPGLTDLVDRMLEKAPKGRPRDGAAVLAALTPIEEALRSTAAEGAPPAQVTRRKATLGKRIGGLRRRRGLQVTTGLALVVALSGTGWYLWTQASRRGHAASAWIAGADGRVSVAVTDFVNQTGDPSLDGLSGLLITSLEQSKRLRVMTRGRMWDLLRSFGKGDVERIDEPLGREVGRRAGIRALLVAGIRKLDDLYVVEMRAVDPQKDEYLFTVREQTTGKKELLGLLDRLSARTREELRESPAEVQGSRVPVAEAMTSSLGAYEHYFLGLRLSEQDRYDEALAEYRKALAVDPRFALAHFQVAYMGEFMGLGKAELRAAMEAALREIDRVPAKERQLIQAWKAHMDGQNDEAHRLYEQAVQAWPQEKRVLYMAGDSYFHDGQVEKALPYFERALQLDPTWEPALLHLSDGLIGRGRRAESLELVRRWVERAPGPGSYRQLALVQADDGRLDEALASARRAYGLQADQMRRDVLAMILIQNRDFSEVVSLLGPVVGDGSRMLDAEPVTYLHQALMLLGRRKEALQVLEHLRVTFPADYRARRVRHFLCEGRPGEARAELDTFAPGWRGGTGPGADEARSRVVQFAAIAALLAPGSPLAEDLARAVPAGQPPEGIVRGLAARRAGRFEEAAALLQPVAKRTDSLGALATCSLGELEAAQGHQAEALAAMKQYQENIYATGPAFSCETWPRSILVSARALDALGRRDEARAKVNALLETWKHADPDLPLLAEARGMKARLATAR